MIERYKRYFEHDARSNRLVLESIGTIPASRAAEEPSRRARAVLMHAMEAKALWLSRLDPVLMDPPAELFPADPTTEAIADRMDRVDAAWHDWLGHMTDARSRNVIEYTATDGGRWRTRIEDVLTQLSQHGVYHRGQIATFVRAAGGTPAVTDWIFAHRERIS